MAGRMTRLPLDRIRSQESSNQHASFGEPVSSMSVFNHFDQAYQVETSQELMLQSLIMPKSQVQQSFSRWLAGVNFEAMDHATLRLVPALFQKFRDDIGDDVHRGRMKGVYRYFHLRNSLLFLAGHRAIERLLDVGIDLLLFKGAAIALKYHMNNATRPMMDMDVLVRRESVQQAEEILNQCGYRYCYPTEKKSRDVHSHDYITKNYSGFDLHWYSLLESPKAGIDTGIWARAENFDWGGLALKVMAPEDLLFTSIVNGVREYRIRPHWIHDVAIILGSEPVIRWKTIWEEARNRNLRKQVFDALNLVRGISTELVPDSILHDFVNNDREFCSDLLGSAIAEGRTYGLNWTKKHEIEHILSAVDTGSPPFTLSSTNLVVSKMPGARGHIRYFLDENNAINGLYLKWRHLPLLAELFEVSDQRMLDELVWHCPKQGEGHLVIPVGLLATKLKPTLEIYGARVVIVDGPLDLVLTPGQVAEITVEVENNTACCWAVCGGSMSLFGLSYHLLSDDCKLLKWDRPRRYLSIPRKGYLAFIEPSQILRFKLKIAAPNELGRYICQLDLVHEHIRWFSAEGCQFPRIGLEVVANEMAGYYAISGPHIIHETNDNETIFIDTDYDAYFTTEGLATFIWTAVAQGYSVRRIIAAVADLSIFPAEEKVVEQFIAKLESEGLIKRTETLENEPADELVAPGSMNVLPPVLTRHPKASELSRLHPVLGVNERMGWPHQTRTNGSVEGVE